ncbi:hypothetical protein NIES4102_14180 [Chondrocystis sp. NIES-4102]|nr:hypothetical protein NIES4102_14180 [Chondrocystis sp. NIES-4102]
MKLLQLPIKLTLVLFTILFSSSSALAQSGNQSDITGPNPGELPTQPPTDETPVTDGENTPTETPVTNGENTPTETPVTNGENTPTETPVTNGENTPTETPVTNGENTPTETPVSNGENTPNTTPVTNGENTPTETPVTNGENTPTNTPVTNRETTPTNTGSNTTKDAPRDGQVAEEKTPERTNSQSPVTRKTEEEETVRVNKLTEEKPQKETAEAEKKEEPAKEDSESASVQEVDRLAYEVQVQEAPVDVAIQMQEEFQLTELMDSSGLQLYGTVPTVNDISQRLGELSDQTGKKPAFINISLQQNQLESFVVLPKDTKAAAKEGDLVAATNINGINSPGTESLSLRKTVKDTSREDLIAIATEFREEVSDAGNLGQAKYMESAQKLYEILIKPIEAELEANDIDILVFSMDSGLRLLPLAALNDGKQFLIEKYAVALVPSFGLTDTRYVNLEQSSILAMGASKFTEQAALPAMPVELETIVSKPRNGEVFLNEQFTIANFKAQNSRETPFPIVHLGTHAEFKAGDLKDSYIQFYDDKLKISQLQQLSNDLGWNSDNTPIELLVLSACETALGDENAELGFAGLAVQAGVKSALASLWYVSDLGTLALMSEFYDQLDNTLLKAEALRQTQLKMLHGNVTVDDRQVKLSNGKSLALPAEFPAGKLSLAHPYFWSSFTLIGNWN